MIRVYSLVFDGCFPNISIKRVVDLFKCLYTHVDFPYLSLRKDTLKQFLSLLLQPLLEDLYLFKGAIQLGVQSVLNLGHAAS